MERKRMTEEELEEILKIIKKIGRSDWKKLCFMVERYFDNKASKLDFDDDFVESIKSSPDFKFMIQLSE